MKSIFLALVAALLFSLLYISTTSAAENRINSFVDVDEIHCYDVVNDITTVLVYGTSVATLDPPRYNGDGLELILYGDLHGNSCWAPVGSVAEGQGWIGVDDGSTITEEAVDVRSADDLPAPAEQIGTNVINDYANCRVTPSLDAEIVTVLEPGSVVIEFADGDTDDGWQWVGLEATDCHVSADLLGEKPVVAVEAAPATDDADVVTESDTVSDAVTAEAVVTPEPAVEDVTVYEEPVQTDVPLVVTHLPSTGSGTAKIVASNLLFWGIVPVGLCIAACIARYQQAKGEKTMSVISRQR